MMSQNEEEQLEDLKNWWGQHGKAIIIGVLLAIAVVSVWKFWQNRQEKNRMQSSFTYQQLLVELQKPKEELKLSNVVAFADKLQADTPDSGYAQYAQLFVATTAVNQNNLPVAEKALQMVLKKPVSPIIAEQAKQKLARVFVAQEKLNEALTLLSTPVDKAFLATRTELKGDVLLKQGNKDEARKAYNEALTAAKEEKLPNSATLILKLKIDDLAKEGA